MDKIFISFITNNHMGIVKELTLLLYYLKLGGNVMVWPAATIELAYQFLMIEFTKRQAKSGRVTTLGLPQKEVFVTSPVVKIGTDPAPAKDRYFAIFNDDYAGVMKSPESVTDAFANLAGIAYVAEATSVEEAYYIIETYSCHRIRWKGAYFSADTFPVLPIAIELDVLYELDYRGFLTEQGLPSWLNDDNTAISDNLRFMLEGGENRGRNG